MDESEKEILEKLKNFDSKKFILKDTYIEIQIKDNFCQGFILEINQNGKIEAFVQNNNKKFDISTDCLNSYYENDYTDKTKLRDNVINRDLLNIPTENIIHFVGEKLKTFNLKQINKNNFGKKGNSNTSLSSISTQGSNKIIINIKNKNSDKKDKDLIDISGYSILQFLCGNLLDYLAIINMNLLNGHLDNYLTNLFTLILDAIKDMGEIVKSNLKKYKIAYFNRKLLISSQIHAILICFDSFIINMKEKYKYNYSKIKDIDIRLTEIANLIYNIVLLSKEKCSIPLPCLITFINLLVYVNVKERIQNYNKLEIYTSLNNHLKNLNENEIKYKKNAEMKDLCSNFIGCLFDKDMDVLNKQTYYYYIISCLKCKNLEKKLNALNDISEIINELDKKKDNKQESQFKQFIESNKILDIIFEESVHDEIIKRSTNLFKYFARCDLLSDNIIEKIIARQSRNDLMRKLLIEIISELPQQKKDKFILKLLQGIKLDNSNNIDYISKLTEACFSKSLNVDITKNNNNYYGLEILFNYIIKDFNDSKKYDENNVDLAIDSFERIIAKIMSLNKFEINNVFLFIDKLFDNIKSNNKHNSVIQSIKLIQKILNILIKSNKDALFENLKNLDQKYDINDLIINDLIRYMKLLPNDYSNEKGKDKIYEGIYPHKTNIEQRLKLIFYFYKKRENNFSLIGRGKKHIEKIYTIFNSEKFKEEQKIFYEIFTKDINEIDDLLLIEFFKDILQNKNKFNLKKINDNESINLVIQTFIKVNENKGVLFYDGRNIRIEQGSKIDGINMLFELLMFNKDRNVQNKISQILCDVCICFKDYNNQNISDYWELYLNKIIENLNNINNSHDKVAFNGIIKLISKIYSSSSNCYGKIPEKDDYHLKSDQFKIYRFLKVGPKKEYKLKVGINDRIIDMRWKLGYFYDIPVNNVTFIDLIGKRYSLNDDFENFISIFSDEKYFKDNNSCFVKVDEAPFQLLQMKNNPKSLIENNESLYNILIDNLKVDLNNNDSVEYENKQKIWNIILQLPKKNYFINKLKKYGSKDSIKDSELLEIFDVKETYLLTYTLKCFYFFIFDKNNDKDVQINQILPNKREFLNNFIRIHKGDILLLNILLSTKIESNDCKPIQIECLTILIDVLIRIEKYKQNEKETKFNNYINNKESIYNFSLINLTNLISNLLELNYTKYIYYFNIEISDTKENASNINEKNKLIINENISKLIENILIFIENLTKDNIDYMQYLFNTNNLFRKVFIEDYIKSETDESRKAIDNFLLRNYNRNNDYIKKYLEIVLTVDLFGYLVENDKAGKYFHVMSSIMKKYYEENINDNHMIIDEPKDSIIDSKHIKQSKQIIDIILTYIQKECDKKEESIENIEEKEAKILMKNKENFKEGILQFLANILNLELKELVSHIMNKINVNDLFLNKCSLRKCVPNPLEKNFPFCRTDQSQNALYNLLLIIIKNAPNNSLYLSIFERLNEFHRYGFWKTKNVKNWELENRDLQKGKYVGLKNMTATCYLNSIIQLLFMIPMFRETILKISNPSKNNVLYELQLLFSSLKIYEFAFYDPRSFVVINKLNFYEQMDADEFYGTLIDRIENDIKQIYYKPTPGDTPEKKNDTPKPSKNDSYKYKEIFNYFFGIKVLDELKFADCGHKRYNEFFYYNIQLEIKKFSNIHESLKNYFKTEIMDGENKINCEQCKIKRTCYKHLIFKSLPNILVIALKRFEFDYNTMLKYKLNTYFEFPHKLDMKNYLIENHIEKNTEYELTGITIHYGIADSGHYYDLIKGPNKKWYKFNDIFVTEFKEEDIPKEAFGEKEISEEDSSKEKESIKNNAYILIYKKKNFEESIDNKIKNDLAIPPFSQYSNINDALKDEINLKLFQSWTLKNITSTSYQGFILSLIKIDLDKYLGKTSKTPKSQNSSSNSFKIFQFAIRYYFCVILRISRKAQNKMKNNNNNKFEEFKKIIDAYIKSDINKAKFLLEEFSNFEAIDEYLTYCPIFESIRDCLFLILNSFDALLDYSSKENNFSIIYEYINTLVIYIDNNIRKVQLEAINWQFIEILKKSPERFLNYLKKKNFSKWISSFYGCGFDVKNIINESIFPPLRSSHSILIDCTYKNSPDKKGFDENDMSDQCFLNKLHDVEKNKNFIKSLQPNFE